MDDGSDKLHDLRRIIEEKIHEVQRKLSKVDQRIEDNADTNTEELDELPANVRDILGRVKEKMEHHKDDMAKSIRLLQEDMDNALEKCNTNMAEKIEKKAIDMREEVQSDWVKYRDDVDGKYSDMVNRLQPRRRKDVRVHANSSNNQEDESVHKGDHHICNVNGHPVGR